MKKTMIFTALLIVALNAAAQVSLLREEIAKDYRFFHENGFKPEGYQYDNHQVNLMLDAALKDRKMGKTALAGAIICAAGSGVLFVANHNHALRDIAAGRPIRDSFNVVNAFGFVALGQSASFVVISLDQLGKSKAKIREAEMMRKNGFHGKGN